MFKEYFNKLYHQSADEFQKEVFKNLKNNKKMFIVTANPETFMVAEKDYILNEILLNKDISIVPDGIGLVKAAKMLGYEVKERIPGIEIVEELLVKANELSKRIYLYGATEKVIILMGELINKKYPNIEILGLKNGYTNDPDKTFEDIVSKQPDIVLVALGIPKQEKLIYKYFNKLQKGILIGVGGSFDTISGYKKRAPFIFRKLNLEWLYRLLKEPKRIKRFYNSNVKFIFKVRRNKK